MGQNDQYVNLIEWATPYLIACNGRYIQSPFFLVVGKLPLCKSESGACCYLDSCFKYNSILLLEMVWSWTNTTISIIFPLKRVTIASIHSFCFFKSGYYFEAPSLVFWEFFSKVRSAKTFVNNPLTKIIYPFVCLKQNFHSSGASKLECLKSCMIFFIFIAWHSWKTCLYFCS